MASLLHQTLVDLLRHAPEVVPRLLKVAGASRDIAVGSVQLIAARGLSVDPGAGPASGRLGSKADRPRAR